MELNFKGKTALVTGAAAGIGRAVAIRFAQYGAKVAILDLNEEKLEYVKKEIEAYTKDVIALKCDISQESEVYEAVKKAEDTLGNIDILVNNAAIWRYLDSFTNVSTDEWRKYMDINVMGTVYCTKAVLSKMIENRYGKIVNVASVAGVYGIANMVHYSATKGAVIAMTRALAKEVIDKGVYVNCVSPGSVSPAENLDMDYYEVSQLCF